MADYDFTTLSPIDFEILSRDLLQEELQVTFESFTSGRDDGIDFRYCPSTDQQTIVQCKHYARSTLSKLLSELKTKEIAKIQKLNPSRYILVTSLALTPSNKLRIQEILHPFVTTIEDIKGKDDLNNLLGKFPRVERQQFKLWMTSVPAFEQILHSKVKNVSRDALNRIRQHARYYVQNDSFKEALQILNRHNFCIIAGIPGIGKTMLAEMLLLHFVDGNYEIVKVISDISEASGLDHSTSRRVFYYDDFLGQHSLGEKLNKNEDEKLLEFIHALRTSPTSKLILTTREYILGQARLRYEKLERTDFKVETYVIDLSKYTRLNRARILFNHIYFSDLPENYKNTVLENRNYLRIIDHENYNPRIVELMTQFTRLAEIQPKQYFQFFLSNLDNPMLIWSHAFEHQLSIAAKHVLIALASLPAEVFLEDCKEAFEVFHKHQANEYRFPIKSRDFTNALKELDGNFVSTEKSRDRVVLRFHNPSVKDFVLNYLKSSEQELASLLESSIFFNQLALLWSIEDHGTPMFQETLINYDSNLIAAIRRTFDSRDCRLINFDGGSGGSYKGVWTTSLEGRCVRVASIASKLRTKEAVSVLDEKLRIVRDRIQAGEADRGEIANLLKSLKESQLLDEDHNQILLLEAKQFLMTPPHWISDFGAIQKLTEAFPKLINERERLKIQMDFLASADKTIERFLDTDYTSDADWIRTQAFYIRDLSKQFHLKPPPTLKKLESHAENLEDRLPPDIDEVNDATKPHHHPCSDHDVDSLFRILAN